MEFRLLGPLEVTHEGAPVLIDGRDRRLVLALLLAHANEVVAADALIAHLAPDGSGDGRQRVQNEISSLQEVLNVEAELLTGKAPGYRLDVGIRQVDALLFDDLVGRAEDVLAEDPAESRELLGEGGAELARFQRREYWSDSDPNTPILQHSNTAPSTLQ